MTHGTVFNSCSMRRMLSASILIERTLRASALWVILFPTSKIIRRRQRHPRLHKERGLIKLERSSKQRIENTKAVAPALSTPVHFALTDMDFFDAAFLTLGFEPPFASS